MMSRTRLNRTKVQRTSGKETQDLEERSGSRKHARLWTTLKSDGNMHTNVGIVTLNERQHPKC